jgi:hypothetical protein
MESDDPWLVAFFCIAGMSMLGSLIVIIHLCLYGDFREFRISFLLLLNGTYFFQSLGYLPVIYLGNLGVCKFMAFSHIYLGLAHVIVEVLMGVHHYCFIIDEKQATQINQFLAKYSLWIIFLIPIIMVLPFSTNSYGSSMGLWCDLPTSNQTANDWALILYYFPVSSMTIFTITQLFYSIYKLYYYHQELIGYLFLSTGAYILVSTFTSIPRIVLRMYYLTHPNAQPSDDAEILSILSLYINGLFYFLLYFAGWKRFPLKIIPGYNDFTMFSVENIVDLQEILDHTGFTSRASNTPIPVLPRLQGDSLFSTSNSIINNPLNRPSMTAAGAGEPEEEIL